MRVWGITPDCSLLKALQMAMSLLTLKKQGLIQDYAPTDTLLDGVASDSRVDVISC
jgi:hypothetical protein